MAPVYVAGDADRGDNGDVLSLDELLEMRRCACRLSQDRALTSLDDAEQFLVDRGMLTRTADCALPSLFEACHEEPYAADKPGFGQWPATKFGWYGELGERGYLVLAVHQGKNLIVTGEVAALCDPICRAEIARLDRADRGSSRLLRHLAEAGPSELGDLQLEMGITPKELRRLRSPLERCGAIVSRSMVYEEPHRHTSVLARWDHVHVVPSGRGVDLGDLLVAAVRAAVVAPEPELRGWFSWKWYWDDLIVDRLVEDGRLE